MNTDRTFKLLIIDPQNDFMDTREASLPVKGAKEDMKNLAGFIRDAGSVLDDIIISLDSHRTYDIGHPGYWLERHIGGHYEIAKPFSQVTSALVESGQFKPAASGPLDLKLTLDYLKNMETKGFPIHMIWPEHCVTGTFGHTIIHFVASAVAGWELSRSRTSTVVLKGMDPRCESFSAVRPEVDDMGNVPVGNTLFFLDSLTEPTPTYLFVGGEAESHCVAATVRHLWNIIPPERIVLLTDCMSPVPGFEAQAMEFRLEAEAKGCRLMNTAMACALIRGERQ